MAAGCGCDVCMMLVALLLSREDSNYIIMIAHMIAHMSSAVFQAAKRQLGLLLRTNLALKNSLNSQLSRLFAPTFCTSLSK